MRQSKRGASRRNNSKMGGQGHPPMLSTSVQVDHAFRFNVATAGGYNVTCKDLGDLLCMADTATSAYQLGRAVRIRKVEMWAGPNAATLAPVTISCEFLGTGGDTTGNSRIWSDTSIGSTRVASLSVGPPKASRAAQWQDSTDTDILCQLGVPVGAIIDIHYSVVLRDGVGVSAVTGAVAGATAVTVYLRALTSTSSTTAIPPVSYLTI